jgi:predicted nucleic acid-binding protein
LTERLVLDSSPLSLLCQRSTARGASEIRSWLAERIGAGATVYVAEIADFEVRRELLRASKATSIQRLDTLILELSYLPLNTAAMRRASEMWAEAHNRGTPTGPPEALDADVILAAQAEGVSGTVITENVRHQRRFVAARRWSDVS